MKQMSFSNANDIETGFVLPLHKLDADCCNGVDRNRSILFVTIEAAAGCPVTVDKVPLLHRLDLNRCAPRA